MRTASGGRSPSHSGAFVVYARTSDASIRSVAEILESVEDIEAAQALTPEERMAFVESMVDGLAARLEAAPDDLDGWLQLARAYTVLGRNNEALAAYQSAEGLLDGLAAEDPRRDVVREGIATNGG